jgi:hypothetical protein
MAWIRNGVAHRDAAWGSAVAGRATKEISAAVVEGIAPSVYSLGVMYEKGAT